MNTYTDPAIKPMGWVEELMKNPPQDTRQFRWLHCDFCGQQSDMFSVSFFSGRFACQGCAVPIRKRIEESKAKNQGDLAVQAAERVFRRKAGEYYDRLVEKSATTKQEDNE